MIRHIVLFRRKPIVPQNPELEQSLVQRMTDLGKQIEFIRRWRVSANEVLRPICWDYALESEVDDIESLNNYLVHPLHQSLISDLKSYFEWVAVDYTV
ncbi:Dabb family protein [Advenella kashmirensis]